MQTADAGWRCRHRTGIESSEKRAVACHKSVIETRSTQPHHCHATGFQRLSRSEILLQCSSSWKAPKTCMILFFHISKDISAQPLYYWARVSHWKKGAMEGPRLTAELESKPYCHLRCRGPTLIVHVFSGFGPPVALTLNASVTVNDLKASFGHLVLKQIYGKQLNIKMSKHNLKPFVQLKLLLWPRRYGAGWLRMSTRTTYSARSEGAAFSRQGARFTNQRLTAQFLLPLAQDELLLPLLLSEKTWTVRIFHNLMAWAWVSSQPYVKITDLALRKLITWQSASSEILFFSAQCCYGTSFAVWKPADAVPSRTCLAGSIAERRQLRGLEACPHCFKSTCHSSQQYRPLSLRAKLRKKVLAFHKFVKTEGHV